MQQKQARVDTLPSSDNLGTCLIMTYLQAVTASARHVSVASFHVVPPRISDGGRVVWHRPQSTHVPSGSRKQDDTGIPDKIEGWKRVVSSRDGR